jgi:serine/threonine protein phosphatase 1
MRPWLQSGGDATLQSYAVTEGAAGSFADIPDSHMHFLKDTLVSYYECESHFFVHAFADAKVPLHEQTDATLYWRKFIHPEPHCSGKTMVCGHSIQESGLPRSLGHAICIDTWAYGEGWLSCLDVESETIWQANEAGETRHFSLHDVGKA